MAHLGLTYEAYELIKEKLFSGEIKPGERIREDIIADEFSMSRTPVREAINQLAADGYVNQIPRKGIFAKEFTQDELNDISECRLLLETNAAKICCEKITDGQEKELESVFNKLKNALLIEDKASYVMFDSMFHRKIAEFTGNKKLIRFVNDIEDNVVIARRMKIYNVRLGYSEAESIKEHEAILEAIKNRDGEAAYKAMAINIRELLYRMEY